MVRENLYYKSVNILSDAYRNNMLRYKSVTHCAVANLIVANMGYRSTDCFIIGNWYLWNIQVDHGGWHDSLHYQKYPEYEVNMLRYYGIDNIKLAERQLRSTGYTFEELVQIEEAFENCKVENETSDYKKGLQAVFNVLREIHQVTAEDLETQINPRRYFNVMPAFVKLFFSQCMCYVTEMKVKLVMIIKKPFIHVTFCDY